MIALLWLPASGLDLTQMIADPAQRRAAQMCESRLSERAGGEIATLAVTKFRQTGRQRILNGTMRVLKRPATRPGEMTPAHIINLGYSYECRLNGRKQAWVKVEPLESR
jgi:hypothetical protein